MNEVKTTKRKVEEIQPLEGFNLVSITKYAKNLTKEKTKVVFGQEVKSKKIGFSTARIHQMFQEGKLDIVSISGFFFVKVPKTVA